MTPQNFPDHTIEDVRDAFRLTKTLGDHTVFIYQLMEVGWPTGGTGSESEQLAYIHRPPGLLAQVNTSVVAWALLHDIELAEFDADLNTVGLITKEGRKKPGFKGRNIRICIHFFKGIWRGDEYKPAIGIELDFTSRKNRPNRKTAWSQETKH